MIKIKDKNDENNYVIYLNLCHMDELVSVMEKFGYFDSSFTEDEKYVYAFLFFTENETFYDFRAFRTFYERLKRIDRVAFSKRFRFDSFEFKLFFSLEELLDMHPDDILAMKKGLHYYGYYKSYLRKVRDFELVKAMNRIYEKLLFHDSSVLDVEKAFASSWFKYAVKLFDDGDYDNLEFLIEKAPFIVRMASRRKNDAFKSHVVKFLLENDG